MTLGPYLPSLDKVVVDPPIQAAAVLVAATCEQFGRRVEGRTVRIIRKVAEAREHQRAASDKQAFVIAAELAPQEHGAAHVDLLPGDRRLLEVETMDYGVLQRSPLLGRLLNRSDLSDLPERRQLHRHAPRVAKTPVAGQTSAFDGTCSTSPAVSNVRKERQSRILLRDMWRVCEETVSSLLACSQDGQRYGRLIAAGGRGHCLRPRGRSGPDARTAADLPAAAEGLVKQDQVLGHVALRHGQLVFLLGQKLLDVQHPIEVGLARVVLLRTKSNDCSAQLGAFGKDCTCCWALRKPMSAFSASALACSTVF